jgi:heme exporter protein D
MSFIRIGFWISLLVSGMVVMMPKRQRRRYLRQLRRYLRRLD